ncbi:MAG: O-antigen ligase family protein, partial [Clostridia bacterium]
ILIGLLLASMIAHIFIYKKAKAMVTTRTQLFAGILFMCIALLLSGADVYSGFSNFEAVGISIEYNIKNLVFALIEIFALFLFYYYFYFTATWDKDSLRFLSFVVTVAGLLVATQLFTRAIIQAVNGNLFIKGTNYSINRGALSLGWGIANNIGGLIVITIPSAMYLATTEKSKSWLYYIFACIIMLANALTMCRTSLVVSLLIFPTCVIITCIKGANRKANLITTGAVFGVILLGVLCFMPQIKELFGRIVNDGLIVGEDGALADSGRIKIWTTALDNLRRAPFFGAGFFTDIYGSLEAGGVFNNMYHNVVMQMIGSCGIVGLLAYFTHCVQIFKVAFNKINLNRLFILLGIVSIIGVSLADNNIFYLSVGLYYSVFLMALEKDSDLTLKLSKINI